MKPLIILVMIVASTASVNAQTLDIFKRKPWEEAKLKRLLQDTLSKFSIVPNLSYSVPLQTKNGVYKIPLKGVYMGDNGKGDEIYAMEPDRMPCLVPAKSFASNMPVAGVDKTDKELLPLLQKDKKEIPEVKIVP
jgi:hypothetical protein